MARNVTYSVVPRINPREKNDPPKYYAQAKASGDVNIREMSERIQATCTVTKADVYAVLVSMEDVIILTEEDYDSSFIKKARINFRPGTALAGMLTTLTYAKVPKKAVPVKEEEEKNDGFEE